MEKYLMTLLAAFTLSSEAATFKQNPVVCGDADEVVAYIKKFNETMIISGKSEYHEDGTLESKGVKAPMFFFVNPETGTWTLVEQHKEGYCIVSSGDAAAVIPKKQKGKDL